MIWIPIVIILVSFAVVVWIVWKKLPQVRAVDVSAIPSEHERKIKEQIIMKKLQRFGGTKLGKFSALVCALAKGVFKYGRRLVQKLYRLEQYYKKANSTSSERFVKYSDEMVREMVEAAWKQIEKEEYIPAEKILIDIISHNPKSVVGYENLGNMYIRSGQYEQAMETLKFALRISPEDASVNVSIAELEMKLGNQKNALTYLRCAVEKRPKNPRDLDYYIDIALGVGALKDARQGLSLLKEVNPENQKIDEFEKRFAELKDEYVAKTQESTRGEPSQCE